MSSLKCDLKCMLVYFVFKLDDLGVKNYDKMLMCGVVCVFGDFLFSTCVSFHTLHFPLDTGTLNLNDLKEN